MDDKELLTQCYHTMYRGMIEKDMEPAVIHEGSQKEWKVVYDRGGSINILEEDLI